MPIAVPPRGLPSSLGSRQARPLNGIEVKEALENHVLSLTDKLLSGAGLLTDRSLELVENTRQVISSELSRQSRLCRINITYPKVGWSIKVRLEELEDGSQFVNGEIELDLERNLRLSIRFGHDSQGRVISSIEEEKIPTGVPDKDRQQFGLPIEAEYLRPDGTVGKVDIRDLQTERRAARSIDVGRAAPDRVPVQIPTDENGIVTTKEVLVATGVSGEKILTSSELPQVTLDDLLATPPELPTEPLSEPLPPSNSMASQTRPNVVVKRGPGRPRKIQ